MNIHLLVSIHVFWLIVMLLYVLPKNISFRRYHYVHTLKTIGVETIFAYSQIARQFYNSSCQPSNTFK